MKTKFWNWALSSLFVVIAALILLFRFNDVYGNLEASFICLVPAFVISHTALRRKINKVHDSVLGKDTTDGGTGN